jgi:hypothetical protein
MSVYQQWALPPCKTVYCISPTVFYENKQRLKYMLSICPAILNTVGHGYNDIVLYEISYIASDILWYQLVPH